MGCPPAYAGTRAQHTHSFSSSDIAFSGGETLSAVRVVASFAEETMLVAPLGTAGPGAREADAIVASEACPDLGKGAGLGCKALFRARPARTPSAQPRCLSRSPSQKNTHSKPGGRCDTPPVRGVCSRLARLVEHLCNGAVLEREKSCGWFRSDPLRLQGGRQGAGSSWGGM